MQTLIKNYPVAHWNSGCIEHNVFIFLGAWRNKVALFTLVANFWWISLCLPYSRMGYIINDVMRREHEWIISQAKTGSSVTSGINSVPSLFVFLTVLRNWTAEDNFWANNLIDYEFKGKRSWNKRLTKMIGLFCLPNCKYESGYSNYIEILFSYIGT